MKVVIYEKNNTFFSVVCSLITGSGYSHGSIYNDGKLYDTTFLRGHFASVNGIKPTRKVSICDIEGDCAEWINDNLGVKYDTLGLLFWYFGISFAHKLYCFEVVDEALKSLGIDLNLGIKKDGGTIIDKLLDEGYEVAVMRGKDFNALYL
tara:strand:- start:19460 stop:19909 length:450 start_codon:yes stop_codon:yes gene_type:complete